MPDGPPFSPESIDAAWDAAHAANSAHASLREAEDDLAAVHRVAGLAMAGITIDPNVIDHLEITRNVKYGEFTRYQDLAAPVMMVEESPFVVEAEREASERTFATGEVLRGLNELHAFARFRGYDSSKPPRAWKTLSSYGNRIHAKDPTEYEPPEDDAVYRAERMARAVVNREPDSFYALDGDMQVDVVSLYYQVRRWIERYPDEIRGLGSVLISFLADYVNHALPDKEKLLVTHPPTPRQEIDHTAEELLDTVHIPGTEGDQQVVTGKSLMRFAISRGDTAQSAPPFTKVLANIARHFRGLSIQRNVFPRWVTDGWVHMGPNQTRGGSGIVGAWGVTPDAFRALVVELEQDPVRRQSISHLSTKGFELMGAYAKALTLQEQDTSDKPNATE